MMRLLLDTHIFLSKILDASEVYISSASIWQLAIKIKLKKLDADLNQIVNSISESGYLELSIKAHHVLALTTLPDIHRDPFDRILIAQAISEPLTFLTIDPQLENYSELVKVLK